MIKHINEVLKKEIYSFDINNPITDEEIKNIEKIIDVPIISYILLFILSFYLFFLTIYNSVDLYYEITFLSIFKTFVPVIISISILEFISQFNSKMKDLELLKDVDEDKEVHIVNIMEYNMKLESYYEKVRRSKRNITIFEYEKLREKIILAEEAYLDYSDLSTVNLSNFIMDTRLIKINRILKNR
jgi:hypothetical protein